MWPGSIAGALMMISHAASCQGVYPAVDVEVERYDYEAAVASVPEGKVAPPRHFRSNKWNHFYFFGKDIKDVNSFKTATHVYCKHCKGTYKRDENNGRRSPPSDHNCWSSNGEEGEEDDDDVVL